MNWKAWLYFGFSFLLVFIFIGVVIYYFRASRKAHVEEPKYRMLDDE
jgi:cbb3-type cytochrome oxidase subunit 3